MSMSDTDAVDNWQRAWQRDQTDVRYDEVSGHLYACFRTSVVGSICGRKQRPASVVGRILYVVGSNGQQLGPSSWPVVLDLSWVGAEGCPWLLRLWRPPASPLSPYLRPSLRPPVLCTTHRPPPHFFAESRHRKPCLPGLSHQFIPPLCTIAKHRPGLGSAGLSHWRRLPA